MYLYNTSPSEPVRNFFYIYISVYKNMIAIIQRLYPSRTHRFRNYSFYTFSTAQKFLKNFSHFGFAMRVCIVCTVHGFLGCNSCPKIHLPPLLLPIHSPPTLFHPSLNYLTCLLSTRRKSESWVLWLRPEIVLFEVRRSLLLIWRRFILIEEAAIELEDFVVARGEIV